MLEIVSHHLQEVLNHRSIGLCVTLRALALYKANGGVDDGFGREPMDLAVFEAEDISGQVERADLPTTVRQQFVTPDRPLNNLIDIICGLCLSENLGLLHVPEFA